MSDVKDGMIEQLKISNELLRSAIAVAKEALEIITGNLEQRFSEAKAQEALAKIEEILK